MDISKPNPPFVSGPVPRHNLAPTTGPDAVYSGLLECPLTSRVEKLYAGGSSGWNDTQDARVFGCDTQRACAHAVGSAADCFAAAKALPALAGAARADRTVHDGATPPGCSVSVTANGTRATATYNTDAHSTACCGLGASSSLAGTARSLATLSLRLDRAAGTALITLSGPAAAWFGVGFNATQMAERPYAIVVDGHGAVSERQLGNHNAGSLLPPSLKTLSSSVADGVRTVVLSRPLAGASPQHYSFEPLVLSLPFINAVGSGPTFGYHKAKTAATLHLWPGGGAPACLCTQPAAPFGRGSGLLKYLPTGETIGFRPDRCSPEPREDLLAQRNPTCDLRTYVGGLTACHDGWHLLDAEQTIPWPDQPLLYYKKFRIWFQEHKAAAAPTAPNHTQIIRHDWGIAADGDHAEYDVIQCARSTPVPQCTHQITGTWMPVPAGGPDLFLVASHHHCHAPTCLRLDMWNNDTGKLICRQEPIHGGAGSGIELPWDEEGYIATPPCLWGSPSHGLEAPPKMNGVTIRVVAVTNSTYGHHGEMALPEISLVEGPL